MRLKKTLLPLKIYTQEKLKRLVLEAYGASGQLPAHDEFNPIKIKNYELLNPKCVFTDDTAMTVAVLIH